MDFFRGRAIYVSRIRRPFVAYFCPSNAPEVFCLRLPTQWPTPVSKRNHAVDSLDMANVH